MSKLGGTNLSEDTDITGGGGGGETNTASNVGTGGVGVLKQKAGVNFELKKINSTTLAITDDTGNNELDVDLDINTLTADATPDGAADYVVSWDDSASSHKKVLIDDLPTGSAAFSGALVHHSATQTVNSTFSALTWDTEDYDTDSWHDTGTNPERLTVPSGVSYVRICMNMMDTSSVTGQWIAALYMNGSDTFPGACRNEIETAGGDAVSVTSPVIAVTPGDYFEMFSFATSSRTTDADARTSFSIEKVG